ncbi:hypothetical protein [Petroclostridium sp. X23]|uniref:hypothetical protein n=1 Tax=Petroclostridium sp. X23 TaxID=3045146 RepID=UPI0024AE5735|nr:hypothetical protein [Petroclostridium sp. X23]WHH60804.1 hypothetical protein QKW49_08935 [Petroclostridium sp. X23]
MRTPIKKDDVRYVKMDITPIGINFIHRSHPWTALWWSAAIPGFGHMHLGAYTRGLIFMAGEIFINLKAHINLAIFYTFTGNFVKANHVLNERWALFYMAVWVFAMHDAWRLTIEGNRICELEEAQEKRYFKRMRLALFSVNMLDQRIPSLAAFFSTILGGSGQLYNGQFVKGFILIGWTMVINYYAQTNHLLSKFFLGKQIYLQNIDWQWLLFLPSIYGFCIWDSYLCAVEINKLLVEEQRYHFGTKKHFHAVSRRRHYPMYLIGTSKQGIDLELIVNSLKTHGLDKYEVFFLDRLNNAKIETGDSIRKSDGISNFNGTMCGATVLMLFGTMWGGSLIPGGPIAIGLSGFVLGGILGYIIDRYIVGWVRVKLNWDPVKGSNPMDGEILILVKTMNKDEYDYAKKIFSEKNVIFVGETEQKSLQAFVS